MAISPLVDVFLRPQQGQAKLASGGYRLRPGRTRSILTKHGPELLGTLWKYRTTVIASLIGQLSLASKP
jgi:hypothetical protein